MRAHHVIAVVAVILVGVGLKLVFFTAPTAEAVSFSVKRAERQGLSGREIPRRATHVRR
jgi:hypothetical protein